MTFRWFGQNDRVSLEHIRQIPGVRGIVRALYDVPVGEPWPREWLEQLAESIDRKRLRLAVIESIPVHEEIKLGLPSRDRWIDNYSEGIRAMQGVGVSVLSGTSTWLPSARLSWMRDSKVPSVLTMGV